MDSFLYGTTVQTKLETTDGRDLHTFTSANISHREVGQKIAARLRQKTLEAVNTMQEDEGPMAWKIRHSIYWLSKSSEGLGAWRSEHALALSYYPIYLPEKAQHTIAKIFLDTLKAAWLLGDLGDLRAYQQPSFEIQTVVAHAKKKVLGLLQAFYKKPFTVPKYDVINELGDLDISTDDEQERKPPQISDYSSLHSSPISDPGLLFRESTNSTRPVELEASSPVSLTDSHSYHTPREFTIPSSTRGGRDLCASNPGSVNATSMSTLADGLHIAQLEDPGADNESIDHTLARLHKNELFNAEMECTQTVWAGFQYNMFSIESSPPHNIAFIPTRVRVFKLDSPVSSHFLVTYRDALPTSQSVIEDSTAALIPVYAFAADRSESSELYISDSGLPPSLRYRFHCKDSNGSHCPWELYGFQGALMGAYFEADYSAASVSLQPCGSRKTERERFPRIQVWTDFPSAHSAMYSNSSSPINSSTTSTPIAAISHRDFSALTSRLTNNVNVSKIFIFSRNFIYVLFGPCPLSFLPFFFSLRPSPRQFKTTIITCIR